MLERLEALSNIHAVSGDEGAIRAYIKPFVEQYADDYWIDAMGNLFAHKSPREGAGALLRKGRGAVPKIAVCAHMDEVGGIVRGILDNGLLAYAAPDIEPRVIVSKRVVVGKKKVPGVIGSKAIHLQTQEDVKAVLDHDALYIDIGAKDRADAETMVELGDYVSFDTKFEEFGDGLVKGKALDDRIGCAILLKMLQQDYACDFYAAFTVQEEQGLRGAKVVSYAVDPALTLVFEGTTANDMPDMRGFEASTIVGQGPAISVFDLATMVLPKMLKAMREVGGEQGIPYQLRRGNRGATEAGAIHRAGAGSIVGGISVPCRYLHGPCLVASKEDFYNAYRLADAFLRTRKYEEVLSDVR